jgi:hypothetical protein
LFQSVESPEKIADEVPTGERQITKPSFPVSIPRKLGGQPRPFLSNASGLTWMQGGNMGAASPGFVLFSEYTGRGNQMSIVSSTESRMGPFRGLRGRPQAVEVS